MGAEDLNSGSRASGTGIIQTDVFITLGFLKTVLRQVEKIPHDLQIQVKFIMSSCLLERSCNVELFFILYLETVSNASPFMVF